MQTAILILIALGVFGFILKIIETSNRQKRRGKTGIIYTDPNYSYVEDNNQLARVTNATFTAQPILNRTEYSVFRVVENLAKAEMPGHRVFAQTSLGEILRCPDHDAYRAINSKRVDILIVNPTGMAVAAIECQGAGHYQKNAAMRDAVKKEALRKVGVPTIEVLPSDGPSNIEAKIMMAVKSVNHQI